MLPPRISVEPAQHTAVATIIQGARRALLLRDAEREVSGTGPSAQSRRRRPLLRGLLECVGQLQELRLAAGRAGEPDTVGLRLRIEPGRERRRRRAPAALNPGRA